MSDSDPSPPPPPYEVDNPTSSTFAHTTPVEALNESSSVRRINQKLANVDGLGISEDGKVVIPPTLERAYSRLLFPPSYVVVGVYRLCTDKSLYVPAWKKCKHGVVRGGVVGTIWALFTFNIQRKFIELFLIHSPRVTGLSEETVFGYRMPFSLPTYAAVFFLSSQVTAILTFFLSRNIRIARERVWEQTVASRGKGKDFWQPYTEEWLRPPQPNPKPFWSLDRWFGSFIARMIVRRVLLAPLNFVPFVGIFISAWFKALGTATYLHKPYFSAKKMTHEQCAIFVEERKWEYRSFGFAAALLESIPLVGLVFTISNRIGAAMWAHDLEKNQHYIASERAKGHVIDGQSLARGGALFTPTEKQRKHLEGISMTDVDIPGDYVGS
ncbi:hypothetical protein PUNSTDRAFT_109399 [Punctularia strigosozonata HHB-11173 SS5]|uniref:Uncharacterized protein n=1 Tax=Punctularia strigosozonata (strain HHB-11173) TaxID=741275 RepID=R7S0Y7_PUNST|nr:uncharacterized protein PUNSTDRAFT_109399 [Punctularia strigosozonata HHB-11173 SS5]EIN03514.1 hypothetical protein PUNSTDRAFT_109399 [Punctularia strigosozonata HHB-11173 SS5]